MIINFLFNSFGSYTRQNIAVDSFRYLRNLYPENIRLWNAQFKDEMDTFQNPYPDIETIFKLSDSKDTVPDLTKKIPLMNEVYNIGLEIPGDYIIICNSDVVIMPNLIQYILEKKIEVVPCSRLDIREIETFHDILGQRIKPIRYNIGFDAFVFEKNWMTRNKSLFQTPYLLGNVSYDMVWAGYMKLFGDNSPIGNNYPPYLFHVFHGDGSIHNDTSERKWNCLKTKESPSNMMMHNIMTYYVNECLMKRTPRGTFLNPTKDERLWENRFFGELTYNRNVV